MSYKRESKSDKRNGEQRSVEEVILRRKLEKMALNESKSMPILQPEKKGGFLPSIPGATPSPTLVGSASHASLRHHHEEPAKMYSEKDVRKMMESVMKYCRALQSRVQELEVKAITGHSEEQNDTQYFDTAHVSSVRFAPNVSVPQMFGDTGKSKMDTRARTMLSTNDLQRSTTTFDDPLLNREIVSSLDSKIGALRDIFRQVDPMEERRLAAVRIQSIIRGFLARARKRLYFAGVREWRWVRCRPVIWVLDILLSNQSKLDSGFHLLKMNRTMKTLKSIYSKWAAVYRQNAPIRRAMRKGAEDRIRNLRHAFMLKHFDALREVTIGLKSRKHANNERRKMVDQIRANLSKKLILNGDLGVVPDSEIMKVLNHKVVEEFQVRKKTLAMQFKMKAWKTLVEMARGFQKAARTFRFRQLAGKCFYAWSDYTYLKSRGLDRKRWPGPRKYEVRYNQKRVDNFARVRCERLIFQAWKAYYGIQHIVKVKFQRKLATLVKDVFAGWKAIAKHQHGLRKRTYDNWTGYAGLMTAGPFRAWADYVKGQKNQFHEHMRIAKSYRRWKARQKVGQIVKVWRHLALFGRLDGLYTRQMLLKTLGEQKMFTSTLEKLMSDQTLELDECKRVLQEEIDKRKAGEGEITHLNATINHMKMTNHHYEQELKRLTATVESMAMINPKQMQHMEDKMPEFKFRERHIALNVNNEPPPLNLLGDANGASDDGTSTAAANNGDGTSGNDDGKESNAAAGGDLTTIDESAGEEPVTKVDSAEGIDATLAPEKPLTVDTAQSLALKLLDGGASDHPSGGPEAGGSSTPVPGGGSGGEGKDAAAAGAKSTTPQDPDQLPAPTNTVENQRLLERVKWIIERYKQCNPADNDFTGGLNQQETALANARAMSANTSVAESGSGFEGGIARAMTMDESGAASVGGNIPLGSATMESGVGQQPQEYETPAIAEEGDGEAGPDGFENEDDVLGGSSRPTTRGSVSMGSKLKPTRSNSYMALANSSLPGLKLPDPVTLSRSPSKSLLRASNPFVKAVDFTPGASFNLRDSVSMAGGGGIAAASFDMAAGGSPPPMTESPLPHGHRRSRSRQGRSSLAVPSFDDSPTSPQQMLRKSPSRSSISMGKSFRASYSRQPSMSFAASMFAPAVQAATSGGHGGHGGGNAAGFGMNEQQMIMAMGYDPRAVSPDSQGGGGGGGEVFYEDDELEDIVITWAKMLFTIMEFLESGDITNLPNEDKRSWALHLLEKDRFAKNTLSMDDQMALNVDLSGIGAGGSGVASGHGSNLASSRVLSAKPGERGAPGIVDPHGLVTQALSTTGDDHAHAMTPSRPPLTMPHDAQNAVEQALMTVDERVHGGVSWREALLKLRTMFPGAGNFSGFGVAIEDTTDTAFFQRLLKMRKELQKVEDIQTHRFQRNMLDQMAAAEQDALYAATRKQGSSPAKKSFAEWRAERTADQDRSELAEQQAYYDSKRSKPLGTDIYASNLKKLLEVERAEADVKAATPKAAASASHGGGGSGSGSGGINVSTFSGVSSNGSVRK